MTAGLKAVFYNHTNQKEWKYNSSEITFLYNGSKINLSGGHGLLGESGSALAPMSELFQKALGITCVFHLSDRSITLSDGSAIIKIIPGSTLAEVNGNNVTMSEAPVILEDEKGVSRLYVPTRFIAGNLGFEYDWNEALSTVSIKKTYTIKYSTSLTGKPIEIPLYNSMSINDIRIEDMYYENKLAVYLPGDYTSQYSNQVIVNHYPEISGIELGVNNQKETVIVFNTTKIIACKPEIKNNKLFLTFDSPKNIYKKIVAIDAGHGAHDTGAIRDELYEKDYNYSIAYTYTKDLFEASDIKVYYTRVSDTYPTLNQRAAFGGQVGADFFVSVHNNTNDNTNLHGTSIYYSSDNNKQYENGFSSKVMAKLFSTNLSEKLDTERIGILNHPLTVTTRNTVPAVLLEIAFMSNPEEFSRLQTEEFQKKAGQVIFDTIKELFELYPTGR